MLISIFLALIIAAGGFCLTYLLEDEEPFLWRISAGLVIGSAIFGTIGFLLSMAVGLNAATVVASLAIMLLPVLLIIRGDRRKVFRHDWAKAKGKLQGANTAKGLRFLYYLSFLLLFTLFFSQAMYQTDQGIFTGGSNNLGDLPFHLGAIFGFADGANFPPQNPSFAGARFSYPFIPDFISAAFLVLGAGVRESIVVLDIVWAFSLLVVLEKFVLKLTNDRFAAKLAPALLFFSGGLGFIWFFSDFGSQAKGFFDLIWQIPKDYTIGQDFRWGNSLVTLFMTQRSLLLGMPLTLVILGTIWRIFSSDTKGTAFLFSIKMVSPALIVAGLLAGTLVLIHPHSLFVLFVVCGFLFLIRPQKVKMVEWLTFAVGVAMIALPELIWTMTGSATDTKKFFDWNFGWDAGDTNFFWFWLKNTGILFPAIGFGLYLVYASRKREKVVGEKGVDAHARHGESAVIPHPLSLLLFYIPFAFLFVVSNAAKLAPWQWDNIKVLIYWYAGSIPFVAIAISWLWRRDLFLKVFAAACFMVLIFSGGLDIWRTITGQIKMGVFSADSVVVADKIKRVTPTHSLFLNAPTYNSTVVLSGRQSLMRYPGHLASYGIDYGQRESDVKTMYSGGANADELLSKYGIDYVVISPEERGSVAPNDQFFKKFPVAAEAGQYKVYKVR